MYLIDEKKNQLVQYTCHFTDREFILDKTGKLLGNLKYRTYESNQMMDTSISILEPIYAHDEEQDNTLVTEIHSKTPYTLAFLGYYMQYNWMQSINYGCDNDANLRKTYFEAQQEKMKNYFMKLNDLKYIFPDYNYNYNKVDAVFESLSKNKEVFELFLQLYHPDCYAFQEIFPYVELTAIHALDLEKSSISDQRIGNMNTTLLKQLRLKPNIRK